MSVDTNGPNIQRLIDATLGDSFYTQLVSFLRAFDGMAQPAVLDKDLATPPASPANGDRYIIAANPTGVWAGKAGQVARYYTSQAGNGWEYWTPRSGWAVAVVDEVDANGPPLRNSYNGSVWGQAAGGGSGGGMTNPMTAQDDIIIGGVSGAPTRLAKPLTVGWVLTFTASGVAWAAASGGGGMTNPMTAAGDLIIGGASGAPTRLAVGNANQVLTVINAATGQLGWVTPSGGGGGGGDFYKDGSVAMTGAFNEAPVVDVPAAATINVGGLAANTLRVTGVDSIRTLSGGVSGSRRTLYFPTAGSDLAHQSSGGPGDMLLPGSATITTKARDMAVFVQNAAGVWVCESYQRGDGTALVGGASGSGDFKKDGSVAMTGAFNEAPIVSVSFAGGTLDLTAVAANTVQINPGGGTGLSAITTMPSGTKRTLVFAYNGLAVQSNANLILPGGTVISTTAGDRAEFVSRGAGVWECNWYTKKDGTPVVGGSDATKLPLAGGKMTGALSEATIVAVSTPASENINAAVLAGNTYSVTGAGAISYLNNSSETSGAVRRMIFNTAGITLRHLGGNLRLPGAAAITTQAGDVAEFVQDTANTWRCSGYERADGTALVGGASGGGDFKANGSVQMTGPVNEAAMVRLGSNTTLDIGAAAANVVDLYYNNSVLINSFGTAAAGIRRTVTRTGRSAAGVIGQDTAAITLTHNSDTLVLPTGANISMRIGDSIEMESLGGGKWHCLNYQRGDGTSLAGGDFKANGSVAMTGPLNQASYSAIPAASSVEIGAVSSDTIRLDPGSGTINTFTGGVPGMRRILYFNGAITLVDSSTLYLPGGANIVTAQRDFAEIVCLASNQWEIVWYQRKDGTPLAASSALATGQAFIEGLVPIWNSANSISLSPGSAYVPGSGKNLTVAATLTISSFVSVANTWYYLYLYDNAGTPAIELVTTAPSATYAGNARTKSGDTSRRFVCALRAVGTNSLARFQVDVTGILNYTNANQGAPYRILSGGAAISNTVIDASSMVPPTTRLGKFQLFNLGTITAVFYPADAPSLNYGNLGAGNRGTGSLIPLDSTQRMGYYNDGSSGGLFYVDVQGYGMDR